MLLCQSIKATNEAFVKLTRAGFSFEYKDGYLKAWGTYPLGTTILTDFGVDDFIRDETTALNSYALCDLKEGVIS